MCDCPINIYNNIGTGDSSTCENVGAGNEVYVNDSVDPFQFRTIVPGVNIGIVQSDTEIQISNTQVAVNSIATSGVGDVPLVQSGTPPIPVIKRLTAGANITLTDNTTDIIIESTGGGNYQDDSFNLGLSSLYDIQTTPTVVIFPNLLIPGGFNGLRYVTGTGIFTVVNTGIYNISFCLAHYRNGSNQTGSVNFYVTLNNDDNLRLVSARNYGTIVYADVNYVNASANVRLEAGDTVRLMAVKSAGIATTYIDNDYSNFSITRLS